VIAGLVFGSDFEIETADFFYETDGSRFSQTVSFDREKDALEEAWLALFYGERIAGMGRPRMGPF
jgi:hypothetical protein